MILMLLYSIGIGAVTGPLGCFILWRRMAYFCESITHSAVLGMALGLIVGLDAHIGIIFSCLVFACLLVWLDTRQLFSIDSVMGILAHAFLAIGVIIYFLLGQSEEHLHDVFLGDISNISLHGLYSIYVILLISSIFFIYYWRKLLLLTISPEIAKVQGINVLGLNIAFMLIASLIVSATIEATGMLLLISLLIIPAATARIIASSPHTMAIYAIILSVCVTVCGSFIALYMQLPTGAVIAAFASLVFAVIYFSYGLISHNNRLSKL